MARDKIELPYGWRDFDQALAARIRRREPASVDTSPAGGIRCPLVSHAHEWLSWRDDKPRAGSVWHGDPALRIHASPTFVLRERLDNVIVGHALAQEAIDGTWGKAETHRLGHENSEDALTWNVFRSIQESGELGMVARVLGDFDSTATPGLYLWGRKLDIDGSHPWPRLKSARNEIEPWGGQQTEPDCCVHLPGEAWLFIEAKFGSRTTTKRDEASRDAWLDRYRETCPGVFDFDAIRRVPPRSFPEQLLRNAALGLRVREGREAVVVVALVREADQSPMHKWASSCLATDADVSVRRATWEQIYAALPGGSGLASLRRYFEDKSLNLRPAFALGQVPAS